MGHWKYIILEIIHVQYNILLILKNVRYWSNLRLLKHFRQYFCTFQVDCSLVLAVQQSPILITSSYTLCFSVKESILEYFDSVPRFWFIVIHPIPNIYLFKSSLFVFHYFSCVYCWLIDCCLNETNESLVVNRVMQDIWGLFIDMISQKLGHG